MSSWSAAQPTEVAGEAGARLVVLAQTRRGYGNLSHWITIARRRAVKGGYLARPSDVEGKAPDAPMLAGLPDCLVLLVPDVSQPFEVIFAHAMWLKTWFQERAAIVVSRLQRPGEEQLIDTIRRVAGFTGLPIAAAGDVLMHCRSRKMLQDVLTAARLSKPVAECGFALASNVEQHLRPFERLEALYPAEWLEQTCVLAETCRFSLDELRYEYPREIVPDGHTPTSWLRALTEDGARRRYASGDDGDNNSNSGPGQVPQQIKDAIERELAVIAQLEYEPYFLTVADVVSWARKHGILCQGRGSAANSAVCFCLGVTEVNPKQATLLFERFISVERKEPPDIDVDFEHQRREEVIQYIYRKYGRHRAGLTAVVISYRPRSALRDVGRALGIDLDRIHAVSKSQQWFDGRQVAAERLRENGFDPDSLLVKRWIELTQELIGFPRHLSQHVGGFVIARDDLLRLVPIENAAMPDRSVVQWDKDDLDALGLIKVDVLALGMLSALRRALQFITGKATTTGAAAETKVGAEGTDDEHHHHNDQLPALSAACSGGGVTLQDIPDNDAATYDMICKADTVGVFQIESRAQMSMLPRLKPRVFYDLVVEVAIVRPGPIQGGMVHPYLKNRSLQDNEVDCPDEIKPALMRTKGVPIFQEQVMQIAMLAADFSGGEADSLRRAMAAWKRKGGLDPFYDRLVGRMVAKGYDRDYAERIFKQIQGFGEYGFPESHAVSFAMLAYKSAWIKCHHPDAFLAALLDSQPMGFYAPAQLVRDAREHGVEVRPVDVCCSLWTTTLEEGRSLPGPESRLESRPPGMHAVRLGFNRVQGLSLEAAERIVAARANAVFDSAEDLARRAGLDANELDLLAGADALAGLFAHGSGHRHQAAWAVKGVDTRPTELLRTARLCEAPAQLHAPSAAEDTWGDYRALGLSLKQHPLALLRDALQRFKVETAAALRGHPHGRIARASGLVTHRQRPETAKGTVFVTLEDETGAINVIVWPQVVEAQRRPLLAAQLLTVYGTWQREGDVMHLLAVKLIDHTGLLHGLVSRSRDFR